MEHAVVPAPWVETHAPVATLLAPFSPHWPWWAVAVVLLCTALILTTRRTPLAVGLAALAATALAIAGDGLVDDAYIQFRYAHHLAAGHGPVFNPGERLEGASGGAWVAALAALERTTGLPAGIVARLLSLLLHPAAVVAAGVTATRLAAGAGGPVAVAWAALPTPALYAATGLETSAWGAALWLLAAGLTTERAGLARTGAALGAALRPEALVLVALVLPTWRRLPRIGRGALVTAAVTLVALATARFLYYASPVPHSALVKGVTGAAGLASGVRYLAHAALEWWPLLLALPVLWGQKRRWGALLIPVLGWTGLVVARGGDWMPGSRYLIPLLVVLSAALALAPARVRVTTAGLLIALAAWRLVPLERPGPAGDLWRAMATHRVQCRWWEALGAWLGVHVPPGSCVAVGPAGALPYASGLPTFDLYGLNTPVRRSGGVTPGHTLWGLPEAVTQGCAVIVPGRPIPQTDDIEGLYGAAQELAAQAPELPERYRPVLLLHPTTRPFDIRRDVIWVRHQLPLARPP